MKKIILLTLSFLALGIPSLGHAYTHNIYFGKAFLLKDGKYSFTLSGKLAQSKTWRIRISNGKPEVLLEEAVRINPAKDIHISFDNSLMSVNGNAWCYNYLRVNIIGAGDLASNWLNIGVKAFNKCKGHRFEVDMDSNGNLVGKI